MLSKEYISQDEYEGYSIEGVNFDSTNIKDQYYIIKLARESIQLLIERFSIWSFLGGLAMFVFGMNVLEESIHAL
jgi:hypothetical protein